jgi:hypothetical protein
MTEQPGARGAPPPSLEDLDPSLRDPDAQKWMDRHIDELRKSVSERRLRYQVLWIGVAAGLVLYAIGYWLKASFSAGVLGLLADLVYTLGFSLWTGVVVVVMVEIIPSAKERQITRSLDAYEAYVRAGRRPSSDSG